MPTIESIVGNMGEPLEHGVPEDEDEEIVAVVYSIYPPTRSSGAQHGQENESHYEVRHSS